MPVASTGTPPACQIARNVGIKSRNERSRIAVLPTSPHFRQKRITVFAHCCDQCARRVRLLMLCSPNQQLQQHRRQIDSFLRQPVIDPPSVRPFRFSDHNSRFFQFSQAVCQDVAGNSFPGILELLECAESPHHQIPHNEQRPAISKALERQADRAPRTMARFRPFGHARQLINLTCLLQVIEIAGGFRAF